ncbi:hypothetical protein [Halopiger goleimassiliensis]|uniref:hypothetical protein n=1 Tax=Halopiger goleimassiliensis TaxID=1293048 RepID=UPI000677B76A|nr:hypothetical protein [Halopiger goleimassiliensis]
MGGQKERFYGDARVLHQQAVRIPLPDREAERAFHENVQTLADALERKARLLADPDVPVLTAHEIELEHAAESFERRLRNIAGEEYESVAMEYYRGERDDRIAEIAAYFVEGAWRIQQRTTVTDMVYAPLLLRYPDCFTLNIRFASDYCASGAIHYESPEHSSVDCDDAYAETYYAESQYTQREAAGYLEDAADVFRQEFPDPDDVPFDERKYGGIASAYGRHGSVFSTVVTRVDPDPDRFSEPATEPTIVEAGPEAQRTEHEFGLDGIVH